MVTPLDMMLKEAMDKEDLNTMSIEESNFDILEYTVCENDPHADINNLFPTEEED